MFARMRTERQERGTGYKTNVSYLEIYNERVMDLLGVGDAAGSTTSTGHSLRVREHRTTGPYVEHLSQHSVQNYEEIQVFVYFGKEIGNFFTHNFLLFRVFPFLHTGIYK